MDVPIRVQGFHGTSVQRAEAILQEGFRASRNEYDWLGDGVYFFQDAPLRAMDWARDLHGPEAAVLRTEIALLDCLDLLDIQWASVLAEAYDGFLAQLKRSGRRAPRQTTGAHRLDRAVINYTVGILAEQGTSIRVVRSAFAEGRPVFPGSALFDRAHVQIAVRDPSLITSCSLAAILGEANDSRA